MSRGSNIKGAPVELTPVRVEQLLGWMDARRAIPRVDAPAPADAVPAQAASRGARLG